MIYSKHILFLFSLLSYLIQARAENIRNKIIYTQFKENEFFMKNETLIFLKNSENDQNFLSKFNENKTDLCSVKTDRLIQFFMDPQNSNATAEEFMPFFLYSSVSLLDYGDYSNCVKQDNYNYLLVMVNIPDFGKAKFGICYFKECNSTYFKNSSNKLIELINSKYKINITNDTLEFSNPRDNLVNYRENLVPGLIITSIIMGMIASFSFIKLISDYLPSKAKKINDSSTISNSYEKLTESEVTNNTFNSSEGRKQNKFIKFLDNFDLIKHSSAIFEVKNQNISSEYLRIFDGVRLLSTCWVVWAHVFYILFPIGYKNIYDFENKLKTFSYCILLSGVVSVDVFFFLSGFLLYFNLKKVLKIQMDLKKKIYFFFHSLIHRYIRLLPFYLIAIFFITYSFPFFINSAKSDNLYTFMNGCQDYWWANLLYIQNFVSGNNCVGHTWYLCDDMIYFIMMIVLLLIIEERKRIQYLIISLFFVFSCIWQIVKCFEYDYSLSIRKFIKIQGNFFNDFYIQPFARIGPYLMGIFYCELFFETDVFNNKNPGEYNTQNDENPEDYSNLLKKFNKYLQKNDKLCIFIFIFSLIEINFAVFINYVPQNYITSQGFDIFLITFNKIFFINGLGNILHLIFLGKLKFIKNFLSLKIFSQLARVTYGVYILHYYITMVFLYNSDTDFRVDMLEFSFMAMGLISISIIFSFFVGIFYESPVISMLKVGKKSEKNNENTIKKISINDNQGKINNEKNIQI